jgi:hypothetical protein
MKLVLKPHKKNNYPIAGIVIKGNSPLIWLQNLQNLAIPITSYVSYPIPGKIANELYGCLVVLPVGLIQKEHAHLYVQLYENKLFIPEFATVTPFLSKDDVDKILGENLHFFHQELGLIELETAIDWAEILNPNRVISVRMTVPHSGVFIPKYLKSMHVEYDEATILEALENPLTEEERMEKLPFDMKKLMAGNKKEMEKFLVFMDKNPELAMKYALPLDTLGAFRGNQSGVFQFGGSFFDSFSSFFGLNNDSDEMGTNKNIISMVSKAVKVIITSFVILVVFYWIFNLIQHNANVNSTNTTSHIGDHFIIVVFLASIGFLIFRLIRNASFDLQGDSPPISKIIMLVILIFAVYFLISYLYSTFGLMKWHVILILVFIGILLYRLFNVNEVIYKDKDEK